ncbi:MAG: sialidase family protein [bacterium]
MIKNIKLLTFWCFILFVVHFLTSCNNKRSISDTNEIYHNTVYYKDGHFAAWSANGGMWAWDNEVLICFTVADHAEKTGHTYNNATAKNMFARSLDGGETWTIENAYKQGITGQAMDHKIGDKAIPPKELGKPMDFSNPNFAILFQRESNRNGPTHFYYTYDRGKSWSGPFNFPNFDSIGVTNRTDYIINGKSDMFVMLSIGHGRTGIAQTRNGGINWELVSYIGPDFTNSEKTYNRNDYSLMPSTVRLSPNEILTTIRHREGDEGHVWITSYFSNDNGLTWQQLPDPVSDNVNSPPALIKLPDNRLVLIYIFRRGGWNAGEKTFSNSSVCAKISSDNGQTWSEEIVLRENDGANSDVGYPKVVMRPDGKLVISYYWNHSLDDERTPYRYIASTIWNPNKW